MVMGGTVDSASTALNCESPNVTFTPIHVSSL